MSIKNDCIVQGKQEALDITEKIVFNTINNFYQLKQLHIDVGLKSEESIDNLIYILAEMAEDCVRYSKLLDGYAVVHYISSDRPIIYSENLLKTPEQNLNLDD